MSMVNTTSNWLRFGVFLSPPASSLQFHWLVTILPSHDPRPTPGPAGSGRAQTLPRWLLPDTDSRIGKDRTGPDLDDQPLSIQYVTETGDPFGQIKLFHPTRRPAVGGRGHPLSGTKERWLAPNVPQTRRRLLPPLPTETSGDWRRSEGETAEGLARLKASFPTPRNAVAYIMDTFPIVQRKNEEKWGDYRTKRD